MASKGRSRWADDGDDDESVEAIAQRKREKEEKKRAKEERLRKGQSQSAVAPSLLASGDVDGDVERPPKRLKPTDETEQAKEGVATTAATSAEPKLLTFPTKRVAACRSVNEYEQLNEIEEGSYGLVSRAREKSSGTIVALKKLKMHSTNDGFPVTGLREIQTLKACRHPHIVHLREVVMGPTLKEYVCHSSPPSPLPLKSADTRRD
jgi:cell division cycle 2-like